MAFAHGLCTMISAIRNTTHIGIKIRAGEIPRERPINLAFLMDVSDSMAGERLTTVKRTLHAAKSLFKPVDQVTLVTFGDYGVVLADHLLLDEAGLQTFYTKVDAIGTSGCTNLSAGIEALLVTQLGKPLFDAIIVLTDGLVNRGVTSTIGLQTMFTGLCSAPITAIGYGANHNRILLRNMALASRGSYVYVDSEALIPMAMGDLISGIRKEVLHGARLIVPPKWICCELGPPSIVGNIVADRDYWVVYQLEGDPDDSFVILTDTNGYHEELVAITASDCHDLHEQVLRCRVARAIAVAADYMERPTRFMAATFNDIAILNDEFAELPEALLARPLVLRMKAQIAEIMAYSSHESDEMLARMSSGVAYLSSQRGVTTGDPNDQLFSSPCQRQASGQVHSQYDNPT